jgi:hypothetical protein
LAYAGQPAPSRFRIRHVGLSPLGRNVGDHELAGGLLAQDVLAKIAQNLVVDWVAGGAVTPGCNPESQPGATHIRYSTRFQLILSSGECEPPGIRTRNQMLRRVLRAYALYPPLPESPILGGILCLAVQSVEGFHPLSPRKVYFWSTLLKPTALLWPFVHNSIHRITWVHLWN